MNVHLPSRVLRCFAVAEKTFLLLELFERVFVRGLLNELIDGLDIPLLRNIDSTILLANAISPLIVQ